MAECWGCEGCWRLRGGFHLRCLLHARHHGAGAWIIRVKFLPEPRATVVTGTIVERLASRLAHPIHTPGVAGEQLALNAVVALCGLCPGCWQRQLFTPHIVWSACAAVAPRLRLRVATCRRCTAAWGEGPAWSCLRVHGWEERGGGVAGEQRSLGRTTGRTGTRIRRTSPPSFGQSSA